MDGDSPGRSILIIGDDADFAQAMVRLLSAGGYQVHWSAHSQEGLATACDTPPDLILLDLMMPAKSGIDVCHELRACPGLQEVPILVVTAFGRQIDEVYGAGRAPLNECVQGYLEKPVEPNVLLARVAEALATT